MNRDEIVNALSLMTDEEFADAVRDSRGEPAELTPIERAAAALRSSRGLDRNKPATKEQAADALRRLRYSD